MMNLSDFSIFLKQNTKIVFLGIGGVSMSSLAFWAKKKNCVVAGFDAASTPVTDDLKKVGITVVHEFSPALYEGANLIVYTGAIHDEDPVLSYPRKCGIPEMTRAEFLGLMMKSAGNPIGISGTHGKSSTTGMLASIFLKSSHPSPTVMAGATLPEIGATYHFGEGEDFIFEACEYQNSFLSFFPRIALILNVEHDHADFFPTLDDVIASFVRFADLAKEGFAVFNAENDGSLAVAEKTKTRAFFFSHKKKADLWCENLKEEKGFYSFDILTKEGPLTSCTLAVPGLHNVENALAAASAAYLSGLSGEEIKKGLESFGGVKRRFEYRGTCGNRKVFDDYAHHPDEIRATLLAAKKLGFEKVTVVFQSHTFTRTRAYWDDFVSVLSEADRVIVADIFPAREEPLPGIDGKTLAAALPCGEYYGDFDAIATKLRGEEDKGLLLIMGAGDIVNLTDLIVDEQ